MNLETAKATFLEMVQTIQPHALSGFLKWIKESDQFDMKDAAEITLQNISDDIRELVPFEAILPSEKTHIPLTGQNSDCQKDVTLHIDSFLYNDEFLDDLVDQGQFSRNYCCDCLSKNTKPFTFISHSASQAMLMFIFKQALPDLSNKTIVDIGSRLGPILYAAHLFTSAKRIIGIEMNSDLCEVQKHITDSYGLDDRITILNEDVLNCSDILKSADVVVMHNVFEFFTEAHNLARMWTFVMGALRRSGMLLVTCPSLDCSLEPIGMSHLIPSWVDEAPLNPNEFIGQDDDDLDDVHLYVVK